MDIQACITGWWFYLASTPKKAECLDDWRCLGMLLHAENGLPITGKCDIGINYYCRKLSQKSVCQRHIKTSSDFAARIFEDLSKVKAYTSARSHFKLLPSTTTAYRSSVLPARSRLLVDRNAELSYNLQGLSSPFLYYTIFSNFYSLKFVDKLK